jgi:hypothetical protein
MRLSRILNLGRRVLPAIALCFAAGPTIAAEPAVRLELQARLFHSTSATFSNDVLAGDAPALINTVARDDPSTASLVTVAVRLAPDMALRSDAMLRFTARSAAASGTAAHTFVDRTLPVGAVASGGVTHVGFWLQGTGCRPVQLQATLAIPGQSPPLRAAATIPFACGE